MHQAIQAPQETQAPQTARATTSPKLGICSKELAYAQVRELIMDAVLLPNHHHLVRTLAERLGHTVEDVALAAVRLNTEGLVCTEPRGGFWVVPMDPAAITDVYRKVSQLEARAVYIAALHGPNPVGLAALDDAIQTMDDALFRRDRVRWARANHHFHRGLIQSSGHTDLIAAALPLSEPLHRARMIALALDSLPVHSLPENAILVDAIRRGAAEEARKLVLTFWRSVAVSFVDLLHVHRMDSVTA